MAKPDIVNALIRPDGRVYRDGGTHQPIRTTISGTTVSGSSGAGPWDESGGNVFLETATNKVGIGTNSPVAVLDVSQASEVTPNLPVLRLDQAKDGMYFIHFIGDEAGDDSGSISTDTLSFSITKFIKININNTEYWIPAYEFSMS